MGKEDLLQAAADLRHLVAAIQTPGIEGAPVTAQQDSFGSTEEMIRLRRL